jgi:hypothetical protein
MEVLDEDKKRKWKEIANWRQWNGRGKKINCTYDLSTRKAAGRKACNYTEVIGTAFKSTPEIGILRLGGCGKRAWIKNDLVADDVGAD